MEQQRQYSLTCSTQDLIVKCSELSYEGDMIMRVSIVLPSYSEGF